MTIDTKRLRRLAEATPFDHQYVDVRKDELIALLDEVDKLRRRINAMAEVATHCPESPHHERACCSATSCSCWCHRQYTAGPPPDGRTVDEHLDELTQRKRPYKPDQKRVDEGDYIRAGGGAICDRCGFPYYDHAPVVGYEWLTRACDGRLLKL